MAILNDEKKKFDSQLESLASASECEAAHKHCCKTSNPAINEKDSAENKHVEKGNRENCPLPHSQPSPIHSQFFSCSEIVGNADIEADDGIDELPLSKDIEINAEERTTDGRLSSDTCYNHEQGNCNTPDENSNDRAESLKQRNIKQHNFEAKDSEVTRFESRVRDSITDTKDEEACTNKELSEGKEGAPVFVIKENGNDPEDLSNVSYTCSGNKRNAVIFYVDSDNLSTVDEVESEICDGEKTNDSVSIGGEFLKCSVRTELEENFLGNSLDVNLDSTSINTISDEDEDYLCTQYSECDLLKETEDRSDNKNCIGNCSCEAATDNTESADKIDNFKTDHSKTDKLVKETTGKEALVDDKVNNVKDVKSENCANEVKILKYFQTQSLVKEDTDSDISAFESFYSLDNTCTAIGTPVVKRIKKTLTWTPRILSEERFSSSRSTTLSSKASFYTAETSGTFFSARSFQLDSCDNFVTCEDFQKLEFDDEPKSKLTKAKNVLVRGRDFVRSKIDCYRKRLPNLASKPNIKSRILCRNSCGFSCVQKGKEISLYSIPDIQTNVKGDNESEVKADSKTKLDPSDNESKNICKAGMSTDPGRDMTVRRVLEEKKEQEGKDKRSEGTAVDLDRTNGKIDDYLVEVTAETGAITGKENERSQSNQEDGSRSMEFVSRGTTEDTEDDLPIGTEATTINQRRSSRDASDPDESRSKKRLRWVSAIEKTQGTSLTSSLTTNSRVQQKLWECVDQLLYQREMDPEMLLTSLGFAGGVQTDDTLNRVPDRFFINQAIKPGVDQYQLMVNHPELHHLLPVMGTSQLLQGSSHTMPETSRVNKAEDGCDVVDSRTGNHEPKKGTMQRPTFSTVATGMKFIRGASMQAPPAPDEEMERINSIPSILDFPNRKALARQGFYGREFASEEPKSDSKSLKRTMSAAEKRKKFHHSVKSRSNWSLTDESEEGSTTGRHDTTTSIDSWDKGLVLNSFSDRFSSESSLESSDSYSNDRYQLQKQRSISNLRKQYEETIMRSMDGEYPVFSEENDTLRDDKKLSLSDLRKHQVDRLMLSVDDDGDYTAQNRTPTNLQEKDPRSALILAQKSTQSTLTGSPLTPKDMKFSFEQNLNDGEEEFNFTSSERPGKLSQQNKQSVSIIIEEEINPQASVQTREVNQRPNSNELTSLALGIRSDSCNTLVPQDSNIDSDGDLTPRAGDGIHGDALSESASSSATLSIVNHDQLDAQIPDQDEMSRSQQGRLDADMIRSRSLDSKNSLKPIQLPPQESFELEEISSADNAFEDWNGNISKSVIRRGTMEKSASTHSDSSGFADLDPAGETTQSSLDVSKETLLAQTKTTDVHSKKNLKTKNSPVSHDNKITQNPQHLLHAQQQENTEYRLAEITETAEKWNATYNVMNEPKHVLVCKKNISTDEDKENKPALSSISYSPNDKIQDKSLVYTLTVPVETVPIETERKEHSATSRYVSTISVNVERKSSANNNQKHFQSPKVTQVGPVTFRKVKSKSALDINKLDLNDEAQETEIVLKNVASDIKDVNENLKFSKLDREKQSVSQSSPDVYKDIKQELTRSVSPFRAKEIVLEKKRAKEALVAANSHTADWLLNNEMHLDTAGRVKSSRVSPFKMGRPVWASTPNLKFKRNGTHYSDDRSRRIKMEGNHSFDLLLDEEPGTRNEQNVTGNHIVPSHSADELEEFGSRRHLEEIGGKLHFGDLRADSACSSMDESVEISRPSLIGSSYGIPEDHLNYLRLARLVNGPSLITDASKMPNSRFTPNFHMKNWTQIPKRKHLEEETLLMQHAVQRYKTELCLMENMLFALYRTAQAELEPEDRLEVEELQHLWCEVRKEVIKMEELLAQRLKAIMAGNETYCPLDALEIIQSMIDLLREQLYHQQMCIGRDVSFTEEEIENEVSRCPSVGSNMSTGSESWMSDISSQMSDIKSTLASAEEKQKKELHDRITELKKSLLSEVKGEMSTTQNAKMLQLQLQARDNEIRRLKMELLLQNVNSGSTRKKQFFESDV